MNGPARGFRVPLLALAASAALHAAVVVGLPGRIVQPDEADPAIYAVTLIPAPPPPVAAPTPAPSPKPRRPRPRPAAIVGSDMLAALPAETMTDAADELAELAAPPEIVALAQPAVPVKALEPPAFPAHALPAEIAIDYQLTSAFADGSATYRWEREGDNAEFFDLFSPRGYATGVNVVLHGLTH